MIGKMNVTLEARAARWIGLGLLVAVILTVNGTACAQVNNQSGNSKHTVRRQYSEDERIRYQLWDYTWNPEPDEPITRIEVRIGEQKIYVYQDEHLAGVTPTTTG